MDAFHTNEITGRHGGEQLYAAGGVIEFAAAANSENRVPVSVIAFNYDTPTTTGIRIAPGAFTKSLKHLKAQGKALPCLLNHDRDKPLGCFDEITNGRHMLKASGFIDTRLTASEQAIIAREAGALSECSVGFIQQATSYNDADDTLLITEARLIEISLTPAGQHPDTRIMSAGDFTARRNQPASPQPAPAVNPLTPACNWAAYMLHNLSNPPTQH